MAQADVGFTPWHRNRLVTVLPAVLPAPVVVQLHKLWEVVMHHLSHEHCMVYTTGHVLTLCMNPCNAVPAQGAPPSLKSRAMLRLGRDSGISSTCMRSHEAQGCCSPLQHACAARRDVRRAYVLLSQQTHPCIQGLELCLSHLHDLLDRYCCCVFRESQGEHAAVWKAGSLHAVPRVRRRKSITDIGYSVGQTL